MLSVLEKLKETQEWACIYYEDNPDGAFNFGKIAAVDEDLILIYSITPQGEYDGYHIESTDAVVRVDTDNRYIEKMSRILSKELPEMIALPDEYDDLMEVIFGYAVKNQMYVSLALGDSGRYDVKGIALDMENGICKVQVLDEYGNPDGISRIDIDIITAMNCDEYSDRIIKRLYIENMNQNAPE